MPGVYRLPVLLFYLLAAPVLQASYFEIAQLVKPQIPLTTKSKISIQIPANARFQDTLTPDSNITVYENSANDTSSAFETAFKARNNRVEVIGECATAECLTLAKNNGSSYLVTFELTHWENRSTTWSGKPDRLTIEVIVYDLADTSVFARSYLHANTTISKSTNGEVAGFLPGIAEQFLVDLYQD